MHKKLVIDYVLKFVLLFTFSCTYFQKKDLDILPVNWSGKIITFVDLDPNYKNLENLNRKWIGFDIDEKYAIITAERLKKTNLTTFFK